MVLQKILHLMVWEWKQNGDMTRDDGEIPDDQQLKEFTRLVFNRRELGTVRLDDLRVGVGLALPFVISLTFGDLSLCKK
jgi:hypothetical protein